MKYVQPFDQPSNPTAAYVDLNAATGTDGSIPPAQFFNDTQAEIINVITYGGLTPSASILTQLRDAIIAIIKSFTIKTILPGSVFYVRTDGSDLNDGSANTSSKAFLTLQGAVNSITSQYSCAGQIEIRIADGSYAPVNVPDSQIGGWRFLGNVATPANVTITAGTLTSNFGHAFSISNGVNADVSGVTVSGSSCGLISFGGTLTFSKIRFSGCTLAHIYANAGIVFGIGNYEIVGAATYHYLAQSGSVRVGYYDGINTYSVAVTLVGTPNFTYFATSGNNGNIIVKSGVVTYSGAATGYRYFVNSSSIINTDGAGVNYFPGNAAGTADATTYGSYS